MAKTKTPRKIPTRTRTVPDNETKAQKFQRLAEPRVNKALKAMTQIKRLTGAGYESTQEQRDKIMIALNHAVDELAKAFEGKKETSGSFKLN